MTPEEQERAAIVAYLQDLAQNVACAIGDRNMYATLMAAVLGIENGDHMEPDPDDLSN